MNLETYQQLNAKFKLRCVYHLGIRSGFFSEYNNMIWAMLYCLRCDFAFQLATRDANFGYKRGWQDYFEPFCTEQQSFFHHRWLHPRFPKSGVKFAIQEYAGNIIKQLEKVDALTYEIWNGMRQQDTGVIEIHATGSHASFRELSAELVAMTWRFNPETQAILDTRRTALKLPARYVGVHIRGGDKSKESDLHDVDAYVEKIRAVSDVRNLFVMSDDYRNVERLRERHPEFRVYTLTPETAGGYRHRASARRCKCARREHHLELFSSIEIMRRAEAVVCTFSSNIGIFLGMAMPPGRCHALDGDWHLW